MKNKLNKLLVTLLGTFIVPISMANTDGFLGESSTGTLDVTLELPTIVQVAGLSNIDLQHSKAGNAGYESVSGSSNFCVFTNNATGEYRISFKGQNDDGNTYNLKSSTGDDTIAYEVFYFDTKVEGGAEGVKFDAGETHNGANGKRDLAVLDCADPNSIGNAGVTVKVKGTDLASAEIGEYKDTLTVMVGAV